MQTADAEAFTARRPAGHGGGRRVRYPFFFVPSDGLLYPSESRKMTDAPMKRGVNQQASWTWVLRYLQDNPDLWLVVPLSAVTHETQREEIKVVRSSIWRSVKRVGGDLNLTSEWWDGRLWVRIYQK